jgi:glucose-1-phosphate adenylyltransferase
MLNDLPPGATQGNMSTVHVEALQYLGAGIQSCHYRAKFVLDEEGRRGTAINSMVAGGCIISGASVRESLLFFDVTVDERSEIFRSVLLPHVTVGRGCRISRAIIDEGCSVPDGMVIGMDTSLDRERFHVTDQGVVLVTEDMLRAELSRPAGQPAVAVTGAAR